MSTLQNSNLFEPLAEEAFFGADPSSNASPSSQSTDSPNLHSVCNSYCNTRGNSGASKNCPIVNVNTNLPAGDYMKYYCGNCGYDATTKVLSCDCTANYDGFGDGVSSSTSIDASKCKSVTVDLRRGSALGPKLVCREPCQTPRDTDTPSDTTSSCKKWSTESIISFAAVGGVLLLVIIILSVLYYKK